MDCPILRTDPWRNEAILLFFKCIYRHIGQFRSITVWNTLYVNNLYILWSASLLRAPDCASARAPHLPAPRRSPQKVARTRRRILSQKKLRGETSDQEEPARRARAGRAVAEEEDRTRTRASSRSGWGETRAPRSEVRGASRATWRHNPARTPLRAPRDQRTAFHYLFHQFVFMA